MSAPTDRAGLKYSRVLCAQIAYGHFLAPTADLSPVPATETRCHPKPKIFTSRRLKEVRSEPRTEGCAELMCWDGGKGQGEVCFAGWRKSPTSSRMTPRLYSEPQNVIPA